jgi:hypothetical protein
MALNGEPDGETGTSGRPAAAGETQRLAEELVELARRSPEELAERVARLTVREQAELALRLPPQQRLELLLHAPRPMRLVRALPDADLYLTVREIGPADAAPVLALGSPSQILHLIDLESWRGDRFDADRAGAWVALLLEAGEPALRRFLLHADDELLSLLLQRWIRVEQIEYEDGAEKHGHGEGDAGTELGTITPDGYHRFSPSIPEHVAAIRRMLQIFFVEKPERYNRVLWDALWELSIELEEQALHWRQSRLEEHGFPDWEEALSVYAAPEGVTEHPEIPRPTDPDGLEASRSFLMVLHQETPLVPAVEALTGAVRERVLFELLSLNNRLLIADAADTGDPAAHRMAIRKAAGYVGIALGARGAEGAPLSAEVLSEVPVLELFREGYARAVALQQRARQVVREGWAAGHPRALELLDSPIRDRVQGLLEPRPLYLELDESGEPGRLRDFLAASELEETRVALEMAEVLGTLLIGGLGLDVTRVLEADASPAGPEAPRFSTMLVTLLAWHATRSELRGDALPADVTADFLRTVASRRTASPEAPGRALESLLRQLAERFELQSREVLILEGYGRFCLDRLSAECGGLDPGIPVDRRVVTCLLVCEES